jgi:hypothetical protein
MGKNPDGEDCVCYDYEFVFSAAPTCIFGFLLNDAQDECIEVVCRNGYGYIEVLNEAGDTCIPEYILCPTGSKLDMFG